MGSKTLQLVCDKKIHCYLEEVETLDDVDIDDDVDTELEVDTLTGKKSQQFITT